MWNWLKSLFYKPKAIIASNKPIIYSLNDPTTPGLKIEVQAPPEPSPAIKVVGYEGGGFQPGTIQAQAANCYVTVATSVAQIREYSANALNKWAATRCLSVKPRTGQDLNAYYDRRGLWFFWFTDRRTGKTIYTCDSTDVVAHELGHATLDALRPDLWSIQSIEAWSLHEGYADISAILHLLNFPVVVDYLLKETGGDLNKHNVVSRLAEEMGDMIYVLADGKGGLKPGALRNAINDFVYVRPEQLPQDGPDDKLLGECHSFGRLFLGAWYEAFVGVYDLHKTKFGPKTAIEMTRDQMGKILLAGVRSAPASVRFYDAVANAMYVFSKQIDPNVADIIQRVFRKRKILFPRITMMAASPKPPQAAYIEGTNKRLAKTSSVRTVILGRTLGITAQNNNPLYDVEIEIPADVGYELNAEGMVIDEKRTDMQETLDGARACLNYLHQNNALGHMFEIVDNKLVRTRFVD